MIAGVMRLSKAVAPLVNLIYPPRCPLCGAALASHGGLCIDCWGQLVVPGEPACARCQRPLPDRSAQQGAEAALAQAEAARGEWICAPCLRDPPRHDGIAAATLYTDVSRRLVLGLKYARRIGLADLMVRLMRARLPDLAGEWVLVPVPLHRWRLWRRGFNQSALLAQGLARATGHTVLVDGLRRTRATPPLGHLGRKQRAALLQGVIRANPACSNRLKGAQVLLVDDVMTSGATTDACLTALRRAGVRTVRIACFARVVDDTQALGRVPDETTAPVEG
jgi:ComF family protein